MEHLPPHVATAGEPIGEPGTDPWSGPDLRQAMPIEVMLGMLHQEAEDAVGYVALWQDFVTSVGGWLSVTIAADGEEQLGLGAPCDPQSRHRSRWLHFLCEDLKNDPERRKILIAQLIARGRYVDNRPVNPRATTHAVRDFLKSGGRILIDPNGKLGEGGELPRAFTHGSDEDAAECIRATKAYYGIRRRCRSDQHIKRAVRMLGSSTPNGWMVLEARP